jgi:hypothetical protein
MLSEEENPWGTEPALLGIVVLLAITLGGVLLYNKINGLKNKKLIPPAPQVNTGYQGKESGCLSRREQCQRHCNTLKMDDSYYSLCPGDCWDKYKGCMKQ